MGSTGNLVMCINTTTIFYKKFEIGRAGAMEFLIYILFFTILKMERNLLPLLY